MDHEFESLTQRVINNAGFNVRILCLGLGTYIIRVLTRAKELNVHLGNLTRARRALRVSST